MSETALLEAEIDLNDIDKMVADIGRGPEAARGAKGMDAACHYHAGLGGKSGAGRAVPGGPGSKKGP